MTPDSTSSNFCNVLMENFYLCTLFSDLISDNLRCVGMEMGVDYFCAGFTNHRCNLLYVSLF